MNLHLLTLSIYFALFVTAIDAAPINKPPKSLGTYGQWHAYEATENGQKLCYMISLPKKSEGKYSKRDAVYAVVTHRPALKSYDVVSLHMGYGIKQGTEVKATIKSKAGLKRYALFTEGETAWCVDDKTDQEMTQFMTTKGSEMIIEGESARGTKTKDIFSLAGSLKAYHAVCKACGITKRNASS